ncbi:hypothetical protein WJX84_003180 [Apatococcus fuscideae]|uniref:GRIP domain-containing protein n=1 Tax=Apatococcus fuscideae TaxID=2026836 RepID=A0AAW1RU68_9CHLO
METRLERQEQAHQQAAASLRRDVSSLQERLTSSQAELASRVSSNCNRAAEGNARDTSRIAGLEVDLQEAQRLHQQDVALISDLQARLADGETSAGDAAAAAGAQAAKLHTELEEQKQQTSQLHSQLQVARQQLEDRGVSQVQQAAGRDLEAELAEVGEVLEGVEEERDALQQQVDRLEASAFQSANQAREHEDVYRTSLEAAQKAEADQKQQDSSAQAQEELVQAEAQRQEQVDQLKKNLTSAREQLEESYAEGCKAEGQLRESQQQLTEIQEQAAQLKADLSSTSSELTALHQELATRKEAHAHLLQQLTDLDGQQASVQEAALEQRLDETQRLAASRQDQVNCLQQEAESHAEAMSIAARAAAAAEATEADLEQQLQEAKSLAQRSQADLDKHRASAVAAAPPDLSGAAQQELLLKLQSAEEATEAAVAERDLAKQQLSRLKAQMVAEQEEEEGGLQWRIDAEVHLALQEATAGEAARLADHQAHVKDLGDQLEEARSREARLEADVKAWQEALPARDTEIQNLQVALGELTYENEARDRNRVDLKAARAEVQGLQSLLASSQTGLQDARREAEANATANHGLRSAQAQQQEVLQRMQDETAMLRRVVRDNMKRLSALDDPASALVDRRLVVKLLLTYFERDQANEVLELMARILGFSGEDVRRIRAAKQAPSGVLRAVAAAPFNFMRRRPPVLQPAASGSPSASQASGNDADSKESISDQWIDFLLKQAKAASTEADHDDAPSAAGPHATFTGLQEDLTAASASTSAPDALEMMASSPPGGFAPGSHSPFQPSFPPATWQAGGGAGRSWLHDPSDP